MLEEAGVDAFASVQIDGSKPLYFPGFEAGGGRDLRLFTGVDLRVTTWRRSG